MKRILTVLLTALMIMGIAACTKNEEPAAEASSAAGLSRWKTLGDIWEFESYGSGSEETFYVRLFEADGVYYRAEADIPQDVLEKLATIDFFDETREEQEKELLKDLPIQKIYNLSEVMLSQSDLDALSGKTGQELLDLGFVPQGSYGFSRAEQVSWASLDKGPFDYEVRFEEYVDVGDDPNVAEVIRPLTVKNVTFSGLSDYGLEKEFDIHGGRLLADYEMWFTGD